VRDWEAKLTPALAENLRQRSAADAALPARITRQPFEGVGYIEIVMNAAPRNHVIHQI
jgi:hypothetical protein